MRPCHDRSVTDLQRDVGATIISGRTATTVTQLPSVRGIERQILRDLIAKTTTDAMDVKAFFADELIRVPDLGIILKNKETQ